MRIKLLLAALIGLISASPADADITARYAQANRPALVVQMNERGDYRVTASDAVYVGTGGVIYMIITDARGTFVARQEDFLSLTSELMARAAAANPQSPIAFEVVDGDRETVAGRTGQVVMLRSRANPSDMFEIVINTDPDLAPLGRAMAAQLGPFFMTVSYQFPGIGEAFAGVLRRGTLLRLGNLWRLESIDTAPVPQSAFALPSRPISKAALAARLRPPGARR
jgi:hypothetical protein